MEGEHETVNLSKLQATKDRLANFREVVTLTWELLTWKQDWFSLLLVAIVTFCYALVWWNEVTVLTALSVLGVGAVCVDLASVHGRGLIGSVFPWTPQREREFTDACLWISHGSTTARKVTAKISECRAASPLIYYSATSAALLLLAWIGSSIPNLLLCYWTTVALVLTPGVTRKEILNKYAGQVCHEIAQLVRRYLPTKRAAAPEAAKED